MVPVPGVSLHMLAAYELDVDSVDGGQVLEHEFVKELVDPRTNEVPQLLRIIRPTVTRNQDVRLLVWAV